MTEEEKQAVGVKDAVCDEEAVRQAEGVAHAVSLGERLCDSDAVKEEEKQAVGVKDAVCDEEAVKLSEAVAHAV